MAPTLTGYGGVGEIGGNAFLLEDAGTRLMLDIGKRFGNSKGVEESNLRPGWGDYWDDFVKPRAFRIVPDLVALGLLPDLPGLWRQDLGGAVAPPAVDAIVISHAHADHFGLLGLVDARIPILTSEDSRATLGSIETTSANGAEADLLTTKCRGALGYTKKGDLTNRPKFAAGPPRTFHTADRQEVGSFRITHFGVDHSIHGARASLVEGPNVTLAYTGDYRLNGRNRQATERFVERVQDVGYLVTEGTRERRSQDRNRHETENEADVEAEVRSLVQREDAKAGGTGFVAVAYPPRDLDRFISLWNVARATGRRLALGTKQAHLLQAMRNAGRTDLPDPAADRTLAVHLRPKTKGILLGEDDHRLRVGQDDLTVQERLVQPDVFDDLLLDDYDAWEKTFVHAPTRVASAEIGRDPNAFLFSLNYWTIADLLDVFPDRSRAGGLYIHSATQPFNDEMESDDRKLRRWLRLYRLDYAETHVSGHLDPKNLDWVIDKVRPRRLVPVHSLAPNETADRYKQRTGQSAVLPEFGQPLTL